MDPTKSIAPEIYKFIVEKGEITALEIQRKLNISQVTLFKHLKRMLESGQIKKIGTPPKVVYLPVIQSNKTSDGSDIKTKLPQSQTDLIQNKFLHITAEGMLIYGLNGFVNWCNKQKLDPVKTSKEYFLTWEKYQKFYTTKKGIDYLDASFKLEETFAKSPALDKMLYLDFYAIERFGKTKLAWLTFQAKQSQDAGLINVIMKEVEAKVKTLVEEFKIEAVGYVPPTVKRRVQFMDLLEQKIDINLPKIRIEKIIYDTPVQQKSLKDKMDRLENATKTFYVPDQKQYKNIMLIDDFVGSGATLNQIASKIKNRSIAKNVVGLALTGSFKGFEVVNQV